MSHTTETVEVGRLETSHVDVRRGVDAGRAFFQRSGGIYNHDPATWTYGGANLQAFVAYAVGVAASLRFVGNGWYSGLVSERMGGADLSWVPGLTVTGVVDLTLTRNNAERSTRRAPATQTTAVQ